MQWVEGHEQTIASIILGTTALTVALIALAIALLGRNQPEVFHTHEDEDKGREIEDEGLGEPHDSDGELVEEPSPRE
jgi:hypothetical protein